MAILALSALLAWLIAVWCGAGLLRIQGPARLLQRLVAAGAAAVLGTILTALLVVLQAFQAFSGEVLVARVSARRLSADEAELLYGSQGRQAALRQAIDPASGPFRASGPLRAIGPHPWPGAPSGIAAPAGGQNPTGSGTPLGVDRRRFGRGVRPTRSVEEGATGLPVGLHEPHGVQRIRVRGDQWAISGGIIKWHPWLTACGARSYHKPMRISGQYSDLARQRSRAPTVHALQPETDWLWEWFYRVDPYLPLVEAVYGASAYAYVEPRAIQEVYVTASGYLIKRASEPPATK